MSNPGTLKERMNYEKSFDCVQCGYCLPACPTYETMETEKHSPRGRIQLMKLAAEGKIGLEELEEPVGKCLGCMACMPVCPTNVQYDQMLEGAKRVIEDNKQKPKLQQAVEHSLLDTLIPSAAGMNTVGNLTWLYQKTGLQKAAQKLRLSTLAPLAMGEFEKVLPPQPSPKERSARPAFRPAHQPEKARVAFFTGCVMDSMFFAINEQSMELLAIAGASVIVPEEQTCCGALHAHSGRHDKAVELAKQNIQMLEELDVDYVVNNAGGCGAQMIRYDHLFEEGTVWHERALAFTNKVRDITQVLADLDSLRFTKPVNERITYQPSCHMTNVQRVTEAPRALMQAIPGIELQEMNDPNFCCGSAGVYNLVQHESSMNILDVKMKDAGSTSTSTIVTTNPGCLLQMKYGAEKAATGQRAVHLVELLMEAEPVPKDYKL
ncbi:glycolate oxidase iron-sulfur subunit [Sinobaca qinghaiensis]|uniref:Glycolate oxidase iron-sulfur subunit n=1 Tax=Sinobaca qinghaiensis TaxID=342944 RepID=A0A419V895_9BACL|nr:(Fe-S)-binding protein [Sinobaca qinghaiensis]RKD76277.1 glycolate oxidase iron-sulfur subunit [Sinobaca qinghaiensis]